MKAHVYKRGTDRYVIVLELGQDEFGKRKQKWVTFHGKWREATAKATELADKIEKKQYVEPGKLTVGEWLTEWQAKWVIDRAPATTRTYATVCAWWTENIGKETLSKLTPVAVQRVVSDSHASGASTATTRLRLTVLRMALKRAVEIELLHRNPAALAQAPRNKHSEVAAVDATTLGRLVAEARKTRWYVPVLLAATTGMRQGEILALRWGDVDLPSGHIIVQSSYDQRAKQRGLTKTRASNRLIPLPGVTVEALKENYSEQARLKEQFNGGYVDRDLVCATERGDFLAATTLRAGFAQICKRCEVKLSFHGLRHTHATILLAAGVPVKVVQERLGHSTSTMTLDRYAAVLPSMQQQAVGVLNGLL